jgi:hypothetical protein
MSKPNPKKPAKAAPAPKAKPRQPSPSRDRPPARSTKPLKLPTLRVDPEKYPNLPANPSLERALRIRQALDQGRPRDEAVALAEQAMGPRGHRTPARPKAAGRPASGPRPGGEAERPRRKPLATKGRR